MDPSREPGLLGRIAVHNKLITIQQLAQATRAQARAPGVKRLGEILIDLGFLTQEQLEWLLGAQKDYLAAQEATAAAEIQVDEPLNLGAFSSGEVEEVLEELELEPLEEELAVPVAAPPAPGLPRAPGLPAAPIASAEIGLDIPVDSVAAEPGAEPAAPGPTGPTPAAAPVAAPAVAVPATVSARPQSSGPRALDVLIKQARAHGASDLHLHSGSPLILRINGSLVPAGAQPFAAAATERMLAQVLSDEQWATLEEHGEIDLAFEVEGVARVRANIYRQHRGLDGAFRLLPLVPPTLTDLGMPTSLAAFTNFHQGMVLVTGPVGCGKSSTLAALINIINEERGDHILCIEDPIEFVHTPKQCVVNQRQVVLHTGSFARALRAALREDPDVIAIGELRDLETVSLAITAAETGHLVLGTLHTNNAIRTINRLIGVFPPEEQDQIRMMLSESLRAIISQRLVPRADGKGRVPALEVLLVNRAVSNLVRENKTFQIQSVLQTGEAHGMCLLDRSLAALVKDGVISHEDALRQCDDPKSLRS